MLNFAISGLMLMTLITIHLLQFRFGHTDQFGLYFSKPPKFLINFLGKRAGVFGRNSLSPWGPMSCGQWPKAR